MARKPIGVPREKKGKLRRTLKQLAGHPAFIPGIYNYCDRWCERCAFTSRCMNYAVGEAMGTEGAAIDPALRDVNNRRFWDSLAEIWRETIEMIMEEMRERGIDPDE